MDAVVDDLAESLGGTAGEADLLAGGEHPHLGGLHGVPCSDIDVCRRLGEPNRRAGCGGV